MGLGGGGGGGLGDDDLRRVSNRLYGSSAGSQSLKEEELTSTPCTVVLGSMREVVVLPTRCLAGAAFCAESEDFLRSVTILLARCGAVRAAATATAAGRMLLRSMLACSRRVEEVEVLFSSGKSLGRSRSRHQRQPHLTATAAHLLADGRKHDELVQEVVMMLCCGFGVSAGGGVDVVVCRGWSW